MSIKAKEIQNSIRTNADPDIAKISQRFFKTGKGEYAAGDLFLGIKVPVLRRIAKQYKNIPEAVAFDILHSEFHEERLFAIFLLVDQYKRGNLKQKESIFKNYLKNTKYINNWDLVDSSAHYIVGAHLENKKRTILYKLAESKLLWERRIAVIATFCFIRKNDFKDTLKLASQLMNDEEDLIHKAVGWMLREVGKRDLLAEDTFLIKNYKNMPRTMLRYAIEKFPEEQRQAYLKGII